MIPSERLVVGRDVDAIQIPYGNVVTVRSGSAVRVTQQLGDTLTLETEHGFLVRIEAKDADALGLDRAALVASPVATGPISEDFIRDLLRSCYDPEIPVNIVDMGLVYACRVMDASGGGKRIEIDMTLTAPGCGMGQVLKDDIERKVTSLEGVREVDVQLVFYPPWEPSMMTEAARLQVGLM